MKSDYWLILLACFVGGIMIPLDSIDDDDEDEKSDHRSSSDSVLRLFQPMSGKK